MPDWKNIVRIRLGAVRLSREFAEEIVDELAGHLEDSYEANVRDGSTTEAALARALEQLESCSTKRFALLMIKEDRMSEFTRTIGWPGLVTFALATMIETVLDLAHIRPKTIPLSNGLFFSLPLAWLCVLPVCGAIGSLISRGKGGSRRQRMTAAAFPAGIMAIVLLLLFVVGWVISLFVENSAWNRAIVVPGVALWLVNYALLTAIPLLVGAAFAERTTKPSWV